MKLPNYSKLPNNRGPETMKGPVFPFPEMLDDDSRNYAIVMNAAKGEPNAEKYLDTDTGV